MHQRTWPCAREQKKDRLRGFLRGVRDRGGALGHLDQRLALSGENSPSAAFHTAAWDAVVAFAFTQVGAGAPPAGVGSSPPVC